MLPHLEEMAPELTLTLRADDEDYDEDYDKDEDDDDDEDEEDESFSATGFGFGFGFGFGLATAFTPATPTASGAAGAASAGASTAGAAGAAARASERDAVRAAVRLWPSLLATVGSAKVLGLAETGRDTARAAPPTTPTVATVLAAQVAPRRGKPSGRRRTAPGARRRPGMVWRDTRVEDLPRGVRIPSTVTGTSGKVTFW